MSNVAHKGSSIALTVPFGYYQPAMEAYSYRLDPAVPSFDDSSPIVFMDGECALCSGAARTIARLDRKNEFRICPVQTALGRAVLAHYGLSAEEPTTWLSLEVGVS